MMIASAWTEWLGLIANFILAGAAVAAVWVGSLKADAVRRELSGRTEHGYASRILQLLYELGNAIDECRENLSPHFGDVDRVIKAHNKLNVPVRESEAFFGDALKDADGAMRRCVFDLRQAARRRDRLADRLTDVQREEIEPILEQGADREDDAFRKLVDEAIEKFEVFLLPKLKG